MSVIKIEAGIDTGAFLINGIPRSTKAYEIIISNTDLSATTGNIKIVGINNNRRIVSQGDLSIWRDNTDSPFADLQSFLTYVQGFFF
jgi:hypothetical protein